MINTKNEEEVVKNQELFRMVFEFATVGVSLTSLEGKFINVNETFSRILGYTREELLRMNFKDITHPDDLAKSIEHTNRLDSGECESFRLEKRYIKKGGKIIWADANITILRDSNNNPLHHIIYLIDITDHKHEDEKLLENDKRSHLLFDNITEGSAYGKVIYDNNGSPIDFIHLDVNSNFEKLTGLKNVIGKRATEIIPDIWEMHRDLLEIYSKVALTGEPERFEMFLKPFNKWFVLSVHSTEKEHFVAVFADITERKHTEEALRQSEERFRQMADNIDEVFWLSSSDNKNIIYINKAYERIWGRNVQELYSNPAKFIESIHEEDKPAVLNESRKYNNGSGPFNIEFRIIHPSNGIRWIWARYFPVRDEQGNIISHTGIAVDITDKKTMVEESVIAKEKAEEMNRIKSYFLSNMSHELRTPMIGIMGFSDILLQETTDEETREKVQIIYDSSNRLMDTLNLILDLSKLEAGKSEMDLQELNITEIVKDAVKVFNLTVKRKGLIMEVNIHDNVKVVLDEKMLLQVLHNLVGNAVKYTDKGKIEINISKKIIDNAETASISVTDTGIGISSEKLDVIFEPFRQVSEGINRRYEGTGIGLTITKKIVELLNGKIFVDSALNHGSTFEVRFPLSKKNTVNELPEQKTTIAAPPLPAKPEKSALQYVLAVEDDLTARVMYKISLSSFCSVDYAADGKTALKMLKKKKYDLILMDINLKGETNGLEATGKIREMEDYKYTPIVAVTAYVMQGDKESFLSRGCSHYLAKPFTRKELVELTKEALRITDKPVLT